MSQRYVQNLWTHTQIELSHLLTSEIYGPKGFDSKRKANDYVRELFIKYNDIMKRLDEIYQTLIHPQKRMIIRILIDGIVGRLLELKQEMIKFDSCEYTYFEDLAYDQNKTLDDICIEVPRAFAIDRFKSIEKRNQMIKIILDRSEISNDSLLLKPSFDSLLALNNDPISNIVPLATVIHILQAHERARQGRVHAYFMRQMKNELKTKEIKSINDNNLHDSCLMIQTIWRQKYAEKLFNRKKNENAKLLRMILPRRKQTSDSTIDNREKQRYDIQVKHQQEFDHISNSIKEKLRRYDETEVKFRIEHVMLQWLLESRQLYGQFPIYPSADLNGSLTLFKEMSISEIQEFVDKQVQVLKNKKINQKELKKQVKKIKKKSNKQKSTMNELEPSKFIPSINNQMNIYKESFYERDESYNKDQHYDILLTMDHFRPEIEDELRRDVDNILRNELIYLKLSIDNIQDKQQRKKSKKKKKKKKRNKKKLKDLVATKTNESIFEELVETGIIIPTKLVQQNDFIGDYQYLSDTLRFNKKEPMPSLLDCQQLVILQIIFPLCKQKY